MIIEWVSEQVSKMNSTIRIGQFLALFCLGVTLAQAQVNLLALEVKSDGPVRVQQLATDGNSSQFFIEIDHAVRPHKHLSHSESIYVVQGEGRMQLGDNTISIKPGDFIHVPEGVVHGVEVTQQPLKVLSVQAPEFDGTDRVWVE